MALEIPTEPELHKQANGQWIIRYPELGSTTGKPRARNLKLDKGSDDEAAGRQLITFKKEWSKMQANPNGFKHSAEVRERWRVAAENKRIKKGAKPRKNKIPRGANAATAEPENQARADTRGGVVPSTALVPVTREDKNAYSRDHYAKRKQEAEQGKASTEAIRRIEEHMGVLAANLEVAGRTLKMIRRMIDELELDRP